MRAWGHAGEGRSLASHPRGVLAWFSGAACRASVTIRRLLWRHPEWPAYGLSGAAWVGLIVRGLDPHAMHHGGGFASSWLHWELMVVAMMLPLVAGALRTTAQKSLWPRRGRAMAGFGLGYLALWGAVGAAFSLLPLEPSPLGAAAGFGLAAAWQLTATQRRAARGCHQTIPLAPRGWRADRDCLRFGWTIGVTCLTSCWALMLACALSGHSLPAMAAATAILAMDRLQRRPQPRRLAAAAAACCFLFVLVGS